MTETAASGVYEVLQNNEGDVLGEWVALQMESGGHALMRESELREHCGEFLRLLKEAARPSDNGSPNRAAWKELREMLSDISRSRSLQGFTPTETATFVFSLKQPLVERLRQHYAHDAQQLASETWQASTLLDSLGLWTFEAYQRGREEVIARQQEEMMELSTPVVSLWDGILALPIIGTLDSARSQVVMESLLHRIVETRSEIAIIDITGVPTVDTLTAQHLLKTVTAARLMGAECIISGIRPQIAQTIVHLGVELHDVITKSTLRDAFALALERSQLRIVPAKTNT